MKKSDITNHLHISTLRASKFNIAYSALFVLQTIIFHAAKVITPELLLKRWVAVASLLSISALVYVVARGRQATNYSYYIALSTIIAADIAFAVFNTYTQRGYASKAVLLFVIPIIIAASFMNRGALFATALLAIAAYSTTAIAYFVLNFNEGYMSELYAEVGFYSGLFALLAGLLWSLTRHRR